MLFITSLQGRPEVRAKTNIIIIIIIITSNDNLQPSTVVSE